MTQWISTLGQPDFRAQQIMRWLYQTDVASIDQMTNLPKDFRVRLADQAHVGRLEVKTAERSQDGTCKLLLRLEDGHTVEAVLIPEGRRNTACISSQAGCGIGCPFCATALGGLIRNLKAGEIVDQVLALQRETGEEVTNIVFMGMGEPFANYREVMKAARILNDPMAFGIGARRITISTSGVVPAIEKYSKEGVQFVLAVSLHAGTNELRNQLVPLNRKYPIERLINACRSYVDQTRRRITFEYVMIKGVNDGADQAHALLHHLQGLLCHINLIPLNPVPESGFERSSIQTIEAFARILQKGGIETTIRRERGVDIQAACGQLRRSRLKEGDER